ncbi:MAG: ATP-binding protein [Longimonas sp.]|uniref:ATP-binding protein n=1 Tax=Longimonas sp. TaxID=2039626 RepID=UPI00397618FD
MVAALLGAGAVFLGVARVYLAPEHVAGRDTERLEEVRATVSTRYQTLRASLVREAEALARDSVIIRSLARASRSTERPNRLVEHLASLDLGERLAVEVYSPTPRLMGWTGFSMPLDSAPDQEAFLRDTQVAVAQKGNAQTALVAWAPVRVEGRAIGAVRVMRQVHVDPPVQNRFIRAYQLSTQWAADLPLPIDISWKIAVPPDADRPSRDASTTVLLRDLREVPIALVHLVRPDTDQLLRMEQERMGDALGGVVAMVLLWLLGGGVYQFQSAWKRTRRTALRSLRAATGWMAALVLGLVALRYIAIYLDIPARWMPADSTGAMLFDPVHLASGVGGGLMRSIGDLLLTGGWVALIGLGLFMLGVRYRLPMAWSDAWATRYTLDGPRRRAVLTAAVGGVVLTVTGLSAALAVAHVVEHAILDSTLNFFARTGLLPSPLILIVFSSLALLLVGLFLGLVALWWMVSRLVLPTWPATYGPGILAALGLACCGVSATTLFVWTAPTEPIVPIVSVGLLISAGGLAFVGRTWPYAGLNHLTVQRLLPAIIILATTLYALLYVGMDEQRRGRMAEAAQSFVEGRNPRLLFALQQIVDGVGADLNRWEAEAITADSLDAIATDALRSSLLTSLSPYESRLVLLDSVGTPQAQYATPGVRPQRVGQTPEDERIFQRMQTLYTMQGSTGPMATPLPEDLRRDRRGRAAVEYVGLQRLQGPSPLHWVMVRIEPRAGLVGSGSDIPRVFLPDGSYNDLYADLALSVFVDGILQRNQGPDVGAGRLRPDVRERLRTTSSFWRHTTEGEHRYLTYYERTADDRVVVARLPTIMPFDHLYYLFRITVAVLGLGLLGYLLGVALRYHLGLIPAPRVRFRDKVLNAFLGVGVAAALAVGVLGVQVVEEESDRGVERRLADALSRVEETLALEARTDERVFRVVERTDMNALAVRMGTDLDVYEDGLLIETSRPRLVRDGLVEPRLPMEVYHALHVEGRRFTTARRSIGTFAYRVGYQALTDASGRTRFVVAVPTLAQQEQLEEEQARTLAYLFGALLMLVIVVMGTASLVASAIAQPIAQLREGLEAVGEGRFARMLPVETRDEIGELVQTFNDMRAQLAEQRRKLAQQERELAWREMARQVAHEIKNPLTPMKLSIQHLKRAFQHRGDASETAPTNAAPKDDDQFAKLFARITDTLIDQINTLSRIANEFSSFARLPTRVPEPLDVNEVAQEAAQLIREEAPDDAFTTTWHDAPLVVEADREELRRVCINLLKNALQAVPDDREPHIQIATTRHAPTSAYPDGYAELTVRDNGVGIPPDERDKIFQPNFSTKTSGTGLGLSIAHKTITELDGAITFTTTEGVGTTFRIRLPLTDVDGNAPSESK